MNKVYITSAVADETSCLRDNFFNIGNTYFQKIQLGIGLVESALSLGKLAAQSMPFAVLFTGTCGVHPQSGIAIGSVVIPKGVRVIDFGESFPANEEKIKDFSPEAYIPELMEKYYPLSLPIVDIPTAAFSYQVKIGVKTVNPVAISNSEKRANILTATGTEIEHLELASLGAFGKRYKIPVYGVLGVANKIGPGAHREWLENHKMAEENSCDLVKWLCHNIF